MSSPGHGQPISRRGALMAAVACAAAACAAPRAGLAFGEEGAFNPRVLLTGTRRWQGTRKRAPARWSLELIRRTSAPARLAPTMVHADQPELLSEPFAIWAGAKQPQPLTRREVRSLRRFIALGGVLLVDELEPAKGAFLKGARQEIKRVLPEGSPITIGPENVIFRSFYLLRRATGRVAHDPKLGAIILSANDLLGALARAPGGVHPLEVLPGGEPQREQAIRLAVNIAMYVLCSSYKDDQVHAPFLMRRRASEQP
jgi:hypothetical protein